MITKKCLYCQVEFEDASRSKNRKFCCTPHQGKYRWLHHKDEMIAYNASYEKDNYRKVRDRKNTYRRERYANDIDFRLSLKLRARISRAIKNNSESLTDNFGCSMSELKIYLQSKFLPDMTWENYSKHGWHIDHIRPLDAFDLTNPEQLKIASHYTNLQPLWAKDNLVKSNKF